MPVTVEVLGLEGLRRGLSGAPKVMEREVRGAMEASLLSLEADMRANGARDTGRMTGSVSHRIEGSGVALTGRAGPQVAYAFYVERGRRPGRYPPIAAIAGWARRHGIAPFLVARAIARRGIRARPFVEPAYRRQRGAIEARFRAIGIKVVASIAGSK